MKKGPNGVDYEYEYVYYYYDDDEKDAKKTTVPTVSAVALSSAAVPTTTTSTTTTSSSTTERALDKDIVRPTAGKNRYSSVERNANATHKPTVAAGEANEIPSSRGKGRQVIPVVEEVIEERLPANTRFPPRNTPSVSVITTVDETTHRISVKRPSLELVDSHSFSRGDKTKASRVVIENEFSRSSSSVAPRDKSVIPLSVSTSSSVVEIDDAGATSTTTAVPTTTVAAAAQEVTTAANDWPEFTTQIMDRVALDLYAHLVNENSIADATTTPDSLDNDGNDDALAGWSIVTTDAAAVTTGADEYTTYIAPTQSTTTTTTEAATTTSTTTTTTTEAALLHGRKSPFGGRNRFRLRPSSTPSAESVERKEQAATESSALKPKSMRTSIYIYTACVRSINNHKNKKQSKLSDKTTHRLECFSDHFLLCFILFMICRFFSDRFSRPSFGRTRTSTPTTTATSAAAVVDEIVTKEDKPAVAASPIRSRSDYFHL